MLSSLKSLGKFLFDLVINSPIFWIAVFTPTIVGKIISNGIEASSKTLQKSPVIVDPKITAALEFFSSAATPGYECAYIDVKLQMFTVIVAFILACFVFLQSVITVNDRHIPCLRPISVFLLSLTLAAFIAYFFFVINISSSIDLGVIQKYTRTCNETVFPPLDSPITFLRFGIIVPAIMLILCRKNASKNESTQ